MSDLLDILASYNRKERFILLTQVVRGDRALEVGDQFREKLAAATGVTVPDEVPFMAMDFHLNWLYGALWEAAGGDIGQQIDVPTYDVEGADPRQAIEPTQEDIDLIMGWRDGGTVHLVLLEAKGHTGWSTKQMLSKAVRLQAIFHGDERVSQYARQHLAVHLVLAGLKLPTDAREFRKDWPQDVREMNTSTSGDPCFLSLTPANTTLRKVGRLSEKGKPSKDGAYHVITMAPTV